VSLELKLEFGSTVKKQFTEGEVAKQDRAPRRLEVQTLPRLQIIANVVNTATTSSCRMT
jgi:hypothetical protein